MVRFLLVHGAWQGGWAWRKIAPALRNAGHDVFAPTLTGLGERVHLGHAGITLDTHIADIVGVIEAEELEDIVLVGHSYGGSVITGVAEQFGDAAPKRIAAMVYLDAFLPESGESSFSRMSADQAAAARQGAAATGEGWRVPGRNSAFHQIRNPEDAAFFDRHIVGHPIGTMEQPIIHNEPWKKISNLTYIRCSAFDPSPFGAIAARLADDPNWTLHTLPCRHIAMLDMPDQLTEILLSVPR
jgi:pimeloyl-ACP methyl ester carboxylesterase